MRARDGCRCSAKPVLFLVSALVLLPAYPAEPQEQPPKGYALVIGINRLLHVSEGISDLQYPSADARAVGKLFAGLGYEPFTLVNERADRRGIVEALNYFAVRVRPQDTFVLFFAGQGVRSSLNGKTYWLTFDSRMESLDVNALRLEHLMDYVADIPADRKLLLLDHCFAGDVVRSVPALGEHRGVQRTAATRPRIEKTTFHGQDFEELAELVSGLVVIAASRDLALESEELGHGFFTAALLEAFGTPNADRNEDGKLSILELADFVEKRVQELSDGHQTPVTAVVLGSEIESWSLGEILTEESIDQTIDKYLSKLTRWDEMGWIGFETKIQSLRVLSNWRDVEAAGVSLSEKDQMMLDAIRRHLDSDGPEEILALSLEEKIRRLTD